MGVQDSTKDGLMEPASFEEVEISAEISRQISTQVSQQLLGSEIRHLKERLGKLEAQNSNVVTSVVVATFVVLGGLAYSTWLFMAEYDRSFLQTQEVIQGQIQELRKENFEFRESLLFGETAVRKKEIDKKEPAAKLPFPLINF